MKRHLFSVLALVGLTLLWVSTAWGKDEGGRTLYQRFGGYDAIAGFVDTAFPRVGAHPELSHLFRGHSVDSQYRQRQLIIDALCNKMGGPCVYIGRDLTTVHVGLNISDAQWKTFIGIITTALRERSIPADVQKEFTALFETQLRQTVVVQ